MIKKILIISFICIGLIYANSTKTIDKKIEKNRKILKSNKHTQKKTILKIQELAQQIKEQNKNIINLEKDINKVNSDIQNHQLLLEISQKKLYILEKKSKKLKSKKANNEEDIVDTIIQNFSSSLALKLASKSTTKELIDIEIFNLLAENSKNKILKLNNNYDLISSNTKSNQESIERLLSYIKKRKRRKETLNSLKTQHSKSLLNLEEKHKIYQKELLGVVQRQKSLTNLLSNLNILKKNELKKANYKRKKQLNALLRKNKSKKSSNDNSSILSASTRNQNYAKHLNLNVRKIGSSISGVRIIKYKGVKTIAPLKFFRVEKKFGTYYDPIYKIKLFNESVVLKPKIPKSKVVAIFNGKVVYAKKNSGMLENVVIVQHRNGLHTIYSHLDEIAPTLKVGKWIKKGYVVGRVSNVLMFQATKKSAHINPKDLFKM